MKIVSTAEEEAKAEAFLLSHEKGHFMQSSEWAAVKSNWRSEVVTAERDGELTGMMRVLIRRVPVFGNMIYCPRGPVCDADDADSLCQLTKGAWELIRRYRAVGVRAEPDFEDGEEAFRANAEKCGWRFYDTRDPHDMIQPKSLFRIELFGKTEEEIFSAFHKKLRYSIRLASRRGVTVVKCGRAEIEEFCRLMEETAARDGFVAREREYFYRMWDCLGEEHRELLLAYYDGVAIAGGFFIMFGKKTWYGYGASADEYRSLMSGHILQWESIRRALARGDVSYDLRGFLEVTDEDAQNAGLFTFKRRFGGRLVRLVGEAYLTKSPIRYRAYRASERIYRALMPAIAKRRKKTEQRRGGASTAPHTAT